MTTETTVSAFRAFHDRRLDGTKTPFGVVCPKCAADSADDDHWSFAPLAAVDQYAECGFCARPWDAKNDRWAR